MKTLALIKDTFREALAQKTIIALFAISTFFLVISLLVALFVQMPSIQGKEAVAASQALGISANEYVIRSIQLVITGFLHLGAIFLSIFATASILPHTMEKGAIDLLLSKPVARVQILTGKFVGCQLIVLANIAYYVLGIWLILSLKSGYWNWNFLLVIPLIGFTFLVIYSAMMVLGISTRSSAATISIVYAFLYFIAPLLNSRESFIFTYVSNDVLQGAITGLYYVLPKPLDHGNIAQSVIMHSSFSWTPLWTDALFAGIMFLLSVYLFRKKDF